MSVAAGIPANYRQVGSRIKAACETTGRDPADVCLVAVSKTQPIDLIQALYDLGHRDFGESRLQEALPKIESLPSDIRWHFIGTLQSNKAKKIASIFEVVHTLASPSQLSELQKSGRAVDCLVEVNIAQEDKKSGLLPKDLDAFVKTVIECPQVHFCGLMTIGPYLVDAEEMRAFFRNLREINARLGGSWLSMGMSHDFEVAIQEGSTHVRVGTSLFGARS